VVTLLAPGFFVAAMVAALGVLAIHFIAWRRPDDLVLPTARFVPDESARRSARTARPADLPLLLLRVAAIVTAGLGLARPVLTPSRSGRAVVVAADRSRAVADGREVLDSALALLGDAATRVVLAFDTASAPVDPAAAAGLSVTGAPGSISAALLAAIREAGRLRQTHDEVTLALVSPLVEEEWDAASIAIRALWPDTILVKRVRPADAGETATLEFAVTEADPVRAGLELARSHARASPEQVTRLVRRAPDASDTAWARAASGVVLAWPRSAGAGATGRPVARPSEGSARGVLVGDAALVGHLLPITLPDEGTVVGRWLDGAPAVREVAFGAGCVRRVGFDVPEAGDLTLTPAFQRLAGALVAPCGGSRRLAPLPDSLVGRLAAIPLTPVVTSRVASTDAPSRAGATLITIATALLVLEMLVRRRWRRWTGAGQAEAA
jgi:hypothetical protein